MSMTLDPLLTAPGIIQLHVAGALSAFVLGLIILLRTKGTRSHIAMGIAWVILMTVTATSAIFIRVTAEHGMPNIAGFSPIHLLVPLTFFGLGQGLLALRRGDGKTHGRHMMSLFFYALVIAGLFTLVPERLFYQVFFGG